MKNKKVLIAIIAMVIIIGIGLVVLFSKDSSDNKKFKKEYGEKVPKNTSIVYLDDSIMEAFSTEDKLVFLGSPSSDDTKKAVSTLLKTAEDNGIDKIYYYDTTNIKSEVKEQLLEKLNSKEIITPTLFLIKDKKTNEKQEGLTDNLQEKYEDVMIAYIMCNNPDC